MTRQLLTDMERQQKAAARAADGSAAGDEERDLMVRLVLGGGQWLCGVGGHAGIRMMLYPGIRVGFRKMELVVGVCWGRDGCVQSCGVVRSAVGRVALCGIAL